jgi:hypothetical protein
MPIRAKHCRRKLRHTTHHQHLPEKVTVLRLRHPFEGQSLAVWSTMQRKGRTILVLVLPDGSKSLIPAEWTDFASRIQAPRTLLAHGGATLGSLEDLLHARAIVDALLSRLPALHRENMGLPATKESPIARKKSQPIRSSSPRNLPVGNPARGTQKTRDRNSGTLHR